MSLSQSREENLRVPYIRVSHCNCTLKHPCFYSECSYHSCIMISLLWECSVIHQWYFINLYPRETQKGMDGFKWTGPCNAKTRPCSLLFWWGWLNVFFCCVSTSLLCCYQFPGDFILPRHFMDKAKSFQKIHFPAFFSILRGMQPKSTVPVSNICVFFSEKRGVVWGWCLRKLTCWKENKHSAWTMLSDCKSCFHSVMPNHQTLGWFLTLRRLKSNHPQNVLSLRDGWVLVKL